MRHQVKRHDRGTGEPLRGHGAKHQCSGWSRHGHDPMQGFVSTRCFLPCRTRVGLDYRRVPCADLAAFRTRWVAWPQNRRTSSGAPRMSWKPGGSGRSDRLQIGSSGRSGRVAPSATAEGLERGEWRPVRGTPPGSPHRWMFQAPASRAQAEEELLLAARRPRPTLAERTRRHALGHRSLQHGFSGRLRLVQGSGGRRGRAALVDEAMRDQRRVPARHRRDAGVRDSSPWSPAWRHDELMSRRSDLECHPRVAIGTRLSGPVEDPRAMTGRMWLLALVRGGGWAGVWHAPFVLAGIGLFFFLIAWKKMRRMQVEA